MRLVEVAEAGTWDRALLALPNPHILQSWAWGEFKARHGWRATRLLFHEAGTTVAAAAVLQRTLPYVPLSMMLSNSFLFGSRQSRCPANPHGPPSMLQSAFVVQVTAVLLLHLLLSWLRKTVFTVPS